MKYLKILFFFFCFSKSLFSDIIFLKNNVSIEGKILLQTREKVNIQLEDGSQKTIDKKDIEKIIYGKTKKEIFEEQKRKQEEELKRKQEEELKRKQEEELKRKQEEELKRKQEEELKRKQEEELKRKQEEELKRKQEEELKRKQEEELKRKQEEELKRKQEEELKRKQEEKKSPHFVYLQSALLPGLGHYRIGQKNKAFVWGGLFLTSVGYFAYNYQKTNFFKNQYFRSSDQLSNLMYLGIVTPFSLEEILLGRTISKNKDLFKKYSQNLSYSSMIVLAIYFSQLYFLKQDWDILIQREAYFIESCRDCQTVFQYATRF
ncbi:MAG: cell envelope integrity protein TolA [Leptonema sp. (in: bacteria)]